jgi:hypothetical protein
MKYTDFVHKLFKLTDEATDDGDDKAQYCAIMILMVVGVLNHGDPDEIDRIYRPITAAAANCGLLPGTKPNKTMFELFLGR